MEVIIDLDKLLIREKEVFDAFTSNGHEVDLLPLLQRYGVEDKRVYNIDKAYKYLLLYVSSKNITDEELSRFNELQKVDPNLIFKRGKKVIQILIRSNNDEKQLYLLASSFAKSDGRVSPYPINYVKKALEYYITHSKRRDLIDTYYSVIELTKNNHNKEFDLRLIEELIKLNDIKSAVAFIENINISDARLINLANSYCVLYPANTTEILYIRQLMDIYTSNQRGKIIPKKEKENRGSIKKLKEILEDYLINDVRDIKETLDKHQVSEYEFNETIRDALIGKDPIVISLIDKYRAKESALTEYKNSVISSIGNQILRGVNYGNGYHEYNEFDFLVQKYEYDIPTICESIKELFNTDEQKRIIKKLEKLELSSTYNSAEDLSSSIGRFSKKGRIITEEEQQKVITFMQENELPINNSVFFATCERYFDGDLVIDNKKTL